MKLKSLLAALAISVATVACTTPGAVTVAQPHTFNESVAYAYGGVTTVAIATTNALNSGVISKADAQKVAVLLHQIRDALDVARSVSGTDLSTAQGKLALASNLLMQAQSYLTVIGVK